MTNLKTRITRLIVVFASLVMLLSTVMFPISADAPGSDPILSGSEYGITYDNGIYTLSIDAERLAEILTNKSFDKETLKSIMPEAVYDLIANRDKESLKALLRDLIDTAELGQLKEDLPLDVFMEVFTSEDIINLVNIDELIKIINIEDIIASMSSYDDIKSLFKDGELDKLIESLDYTGIFDDIKSDTTKLQQLFNALSFDDIKPALKEDVYTIIKKLIEDKKVNLAVLITDDVVEDLLEDNIITNSDIVDLSDEDKDIIIKNILSDNALVAQIFSNADIISAIKNDQILINDMVGALIQSNEIVNIFLGNSSIVNSIIEGLTIDQIKNIVMYKPDFITTEIIEELAKMDDFKALVNSSDIQALRDGGYLTDDEIIDLAVNNINWIDFSKVDINEILKYISAEEIKSVINPTTDDLIILFNSLSASKKRSILTTFESAINKSAFDINDIKPFIDSVSPQEVYNAGILTDLEIESIIAGCELSQSDLSYIMNLKGYSSANQITFEDLVELNYVGINDIKPFVGADDTQKLINLIGNDNVINVAINKGYINFSNINFALIYPSIITTSDIQNSGIITDAHIQNLVAKLTDDEKCAIASSDTIDIDCIIVSKIEFSKISDKVSAQDILNSGIINSKLNSLTPDMIKNAGITAEFILNNIPDISTFTQELYEENLINFSSVNFEHIVSLINQDTQTRDKIIDILKANNAVMTDVHSLIDHEIDLITSIFSIKSLYNDGIIPNDIVFKVIHEDEFESVLNILSNNEINVFDCITDIPTLFSYVNIPKLLENDAVINEIITILGARTLVDEVMEQKGDAIFKALDINAVIQLPAVESALNSLSLSQIKAIVKIDVLKDMIVNKATQFLINKVNVIMLNDELVFVKYQGFDIAKIEHELIDAIPTFDKIAVMTGSEAASFVITASIVTPEGNKMYNFGFKIELTGDTTAIKEYTTKLTEYVSFVADKDGNVTTKVNLPAKIADLYISAIDGDKLPVSVKNKLKDIANLEFNKSDISDIGDAIIKKLTIAELKELLAAVDLGSLDEKLLEQLNIRESQAQVILDYAIKGVNKMVSILETNPQADAILSNFYDKTIMDFYTGNGTFNLDFDFTIDVMDFINKIDNLPNELRNYLNNSELYHNVSTTITFENLYSAEFIKDGEVFYTAFRTEGYDISKITALPYAPHGWGDADGIKIEKMPATDVQLAERYIATFKALNSKDQIVDVFTVPFTELNTLITAPTIDPVDHYTFEWDDFIVGLNDFTVFGRFSPITYTVTFVDENGANVAGPFEYTIEDTSDVIVPTVPTKDHYNGVWEDYILDGSKDKVAPVYTAIKYYIEFVDENGGNVAGPFEYTIEDTSAVIVPAVPEKEHYTGVWEDYTLDGSKDTVRPIYTSIPTPPTPTTYTITFVANGMVVGTRTYSVGDAYVYAPSVPVKKGYAGAWEPYSLDGGNKTVNAIYTLVTYNLTFVDINGNEIANVPFDIFTDPSTIKAPSITSDKAGYKVFWPEFEVFDDARFDETGSYSCVIKALSSTIQYTATFIADGKVVAEIPFTVETVTLYQPVIPEKDGYTAVWSEHSIEAKDITIEAVYSAIKYSVTFIADGKEVAVLYYTVEDKAITEPAVPEKDGYTGAWEAYTLDIGNKEVRAVYTLDLEVAQPAPAFWWSMIGVLAVASLVIVVVFVKLRKRRLGF